MASMNKRCPFRKYDEDSSIYRKDEYFKYCLGEECMACLTLEDGREICGLIMKPILHQEVEFLK